MKLLFSGLLFLACLLNYPVRISAQCGMLQPNNSSGYSSLASTASNYTGVLDHVPRTGNINALFIFVQFKDDSYKSCQQFNGYASSNGRPLFTEVPYTNCTFNGNLNTDSWQVGGYQSWTENPTSEWPSNLPNTGSDPTHMRQLPSWAQNGLVDNPNSNIITPNSITDYYHKISNGKFTVRGKVWPYTYVTSLNKSDYVNSSSPFWDAAGKIAHETISYVGSNPSGIDFTASYWDEYKNGEGHINRMPDGVFDMVVLVYRFAKEIIYTGSEYSFAGLSDGSLSPSGASMLKLGNKEVKGGTYGGSGVIVVGQQKKKILRTTMHEIGHHQFFYHADGDSRTPINSNFVDHFSITGGGHDLAFSAPDRIKVGWANIQYVDANSISSNTTYNLIEPTTSDFTSSDVLWIRNGSNMNCGDIVIEARQRISILDRAPIQGVVGEDDGDGADYYLPDEGIYIYKAHDGSSACNDYGEVRGFSSMPNGGIARNRRGPGVMNKRHGGYIPGDVYSPFSVATHDFHTSPLDQRIAITDIIKSGNSFNFTVWSNYLTSTSTNKVLSTFYNFNNDPKNIRQASGANLYGSFTLTGSPTIGTSATTTNLSFDTNSQLILNGTGINLKNTVMKGIAGNGSGTWRGVTMNYGSSAVFDNSKILNVGGCWGCAALSVNSASVTLNNSEIDVPAGGAVSGLYANAYGGSNSVSINNSKIKSASDIAIKAFGLPVHVANSQIVQANGTTALYTTNTTTTLGNDKLKGGKLSAGYNGAILGGLYSGYGSHNHFCDAASSSLEAFSGGYIYANNNYWNNTPTMSGSPIYYNGSMGAPNCTGVSTTQSTASEIARSVQNLRAQALGVGDAHLKPLWNRP